MKLYQRIKKIDLDQEDMKEMINSDRMQLNIQ